MGLRGAFSEVRGVKTPQLVRPRELVNRWDMLVMGVWCSAVQCSAVYTGQNLQQTQTEAGEENRDENKPVWSRGRSVIAEWQVWRHSWSVWQLVSTLYLEPISSLQVSLK